MTSHELIYFNGAGRAEAIRICLHIAKAKWTDTRVEGKDWPALKPTMPLGSMPVLKIGDGDDSFAHCQSIALGRYAAKLAGMYPEDPIQALYVDEAMETLDEMMSKIPKKTDGMSDEDFQTARQEFQNTIMTKFTSFVESIIQSNGGGKSVVKDQLTLADLGVQGVVQMVEAGWFDHIDKDFFKAYPGITATIESVANNEGVLSYYESIKKE